MEYILGVAPFMGRLFECTPDTLIPREDTELLTRVTLSFIEKAREKSDEAPRVIEIGTGCGNIAVTLAILAEKAVIRASDISEEAVAVARRNVNRHGLGKRVTMECGDMFEPHRDAGFERNTDIVTCNPPYIPSASLKKLDREITDNEPVLALDAGTFGIDIFRRLIGGAVEFLRPGGVLTFEFGSGQEKLVERLLSRREEYSGFRLHRYGDEARVASAVYDPK
jgi:release factor glutamine methyltransferase